MPTHTICPSCQAVWTMEEIEFQECDACDYPNVNEDEAEDDPRRKPYTKQEYNIFGKRNDDTD